MRMDRPKYLAKEVEESVWNSWSKSQQEFVVGLEHKKVDSSECKGYKLMNNYSEKEWGFGAARSDCGEICDDCKFPYCFYAYPRNWSMSADADVWNLMKCGNVDCGKLFESCL